MDDLSSDATRLFTNHIFGSAGQRMHWARHLKPQIAYYAKPDRALCFLILIRHAIRHGTFGTGQ
jgi:hypothetical protein